MDGNVLDSIWKMGGEIVLPCFTSENWDAIWEIRGKYTIQMSFSLGTRNCGIFHLGLPEGKWLGSGIFRHEGVRGYTAVAFSWIPNAA